MHKPGKGKHLFYATINGPASDRELKCPFFQTKTADEIFRYHTFLVDEKRLTKQAIQTLDRLTFQSMLRHVEIKEKKTTHN